MDTCAGMEIFPKSPSEMVGGLRYFARMLDKIRLRARGELHSDYHANLGHRKAADGTMCNFFADRLRAAAPARDGRWHRRGDLGMVLPKWSAVKRGRS